MRLALYARVSSARQEREQTIASQLDALRAYAAELGAEIVPDGRDDIYADDGYSGGTLNRPAVTRLREAIRAKRVDAVMAYDLDRLGRDRADLFTLVREINQAGAVLLLAKERRRFEDTDEGVVMSSTFAMVAELERRRIGERARRGGARRARVEGRKNGGFPSFGFDLADGRYVINPDEAEWCRTMARWLVVDGLTAGVIAGRLTELRVPTKWDALGIHRSGSKRQAGSWWPDQVRRILTDRLYAGEWTYHAWDGEEIVTAVPAIFTPDEIGTHRRWISSNRSARTHDGTAVALLRGLVVCGECGRRYLAGRTGGKNGRQLIYRCGVMHHPAARRDCHNKSWTAKRLEGLVWGSIVDLVTDPAAVLAGIEELNAEDQAPRLRIDQLEQRLRTLDEEDRRIRDAFAAGRIYTASQADDELKRRAKARAIVGRELADIRGRAARVARASERRANVEAAVATVRRRLPELDTTERIRLLRDLVERITVTGEEVEIEVLALTSSPERTSPGGPT